MEMTTRSWIAQCLAVFYLNIRLPPYPFYIPLSLILSLYPFLSSLRDIYIYISFLLSFLACWCVLPAFPMSKGYLRRRQEFNWEALGSMFTVGKCENINIMFTCLKYLDVCVPNIFSWSVVNSETAAGPCGFLEKHRHHQSQRGSLVPSLQVTLRIWGCNVVSVKICSVTQTDSLWHSLSLWHTLTLH